MKTTVKHLVAAVWLMGAMFVLTIAVMAHEETYTGTVVTVEPNPYAASDGVLARLELKVSDRQRTMVFDITPNTRLWRGNSMGSLAGAGIEKDEPAAVRFNHDEPDAGALEIRLAAQK